MKSDPRDRTDNLIRMTISGTERNTPAGDGRTRAFTLLEMILVAALLAISVAIGAPYFAQSIRGNRLQIGARTVTMAARYARSMAIMRQETFRLTATLEGNEITISSVNGRPRDNGALYTAASFDGGVGSWAEPLPETTAEGNGGPSAIRRKLEGIRIVEFRAGDGDWRHEGTFEVLFYPNGTCNPFELRLRERAGRDMLIHVDELGSVRVLRDDGTR